MKVASSIFAIQPQVDLHRIATPTLHDPACIRFRHAAQVLGIVEFLNDLVRVDRPFLFDDLSLQFSHHAVEVDFLYSIPHVISLFLAN